MDKKGIEQRSAMDFNQIPFIQAVMENLASHPTEVTGDSGSLAVGRFYYNTTDQLPYIYGSAGWSVFGGSSITTTVVGLLKGNGSSVVAAVAGVDFQEPLTGTGFVKSTAGVINYDTSTYSLDSHNHASVYQPLDGDLTAIAELSGTTGLLKKTAENTWSVDTSTYITSISSGDVTTALGFTPYNATNPSGYTSNTGTVVSVSVASANGFGGSVANSTTTPAITLTTTISGILKGSASALVAATAGSDYVAPGGALGTPSSGNLTNCTFPVLNQSTTGNAATATTALAADAATLNLGTSTASAINLGTASTTQTINIGTGSGTTTINLGGAGDTVAIAGTLATINTTNIAVSDKLITLNKNGVASSGAVSGLEIEEASAISGYFRTTGDRTGFEMKAPGTAGILTFTPGATNTSVILSSDSRLTNSRPASDVSAWAKAATKPSYALNEITSAALTATTGTFTSSIQASCLLVNGSTNSAAGSILWTPSQGLLLWPKTGSTYDFSLVNAANTAYVMTLPTGTNNVNFHGNITANGSINALSGSFTGTFAAGVSTLTDSSAVSTKPLVITNNYGTSMDQVVCGITMGRSAGIAFGGVYGAGCKRLRPRLFVLQDQDIRRPWIRNKTNHCCYWPCHFYR